MTKLFIDDGTPNDAMALTPGSLVLPPVTDLKTWASLSHDIKRARHSRYIRSKSCGDVWDVLWRFDFQGMSVRNVFRPYADLVVELSELNEYQFKLWHSSSCEVFEVRWRDERAAGADPTQYDPRMLIREMLENHSPVSDEMVEAYEQRLWTVFAPYAAPKA